MVVSLGTSGTAFLISSTGSSDESGEVAGFAEIYAGEVTEESMPTAYMCTILLHLGRSKRSRVLAGGGHKNPDAVQGVYAGELLPQMSYQTLCVGSR